jgi:hypothetical protein
MFVRGYESELSRISRSDGDMGDIGLVTLPFELVLDRLF